MTDCAGKRAENQGSPGHGRIDVPRFKDLVNGRALDIISKRMKIVGKPTAREVRIINTHRGEKTASASWNTAKGVFCDKGDPSYNGDIVNFVMKCDGVSFADAVRIVAEEAGVDIPFLDATTSKPARTRASPDRTAATNSAPPPKPNPGRLAHSPRPALITPASIARKRRPSRGSSALARPGEKRQLFSIPLARHTSTHARSPWHARNLGWVTTMRTPFTSASRLRVARPNALWWAASRP